MAFKNIGRIIEKYAYAYLHKHNKSQYKKYWHSPLPSLVPAFLCVDCILRISPYSAKLPSHPLNGRVFLFFNQSLLKSSIDSLASHWPSLGHMPILEPVVVARRRRHSDWTGLDHMSKQAAKRRLTPSSHSGLRGGGGLGFPRVRGPYPRNAKPWWVFVYTDTADGSTPHPAPMVTSFMASKSRARLYFNLHPKWGEALFIKMVVFIKIGVEILAMVNWNSRTPSCQGYSV